MYGGQTEIAVFAFESGEVRRLTDDDENDLLPAWSMDGSLIGFAGVRGDNWDVWTVTEDGSPGVDLPGVPSPGTTTRLEPSWVVR